MKIDFKSSKWDKEMKNKSNAKKDCYRNGYYVGIKSVYNKFKNPGYAHSDYIWLYSCFSGWFELIAEQHLIDNNHKKVIESIFLSTKSWFIFKEFLDKGIDTKCTNIESLLNEYEYTICKLISINHMKNCDRDFEDSITANLYYMNEEKASKLIDEISDYGGEIESVYFRNPIFLKEIYKAILERDAKKFNDALIKRIKKYRKNMVGYSTIVDYTSIALLKIAEKYGIEKSINVVEIPEFFWDPTPIDENIRTCIDPSNL